MKLIIFLTLISFASPWTCTTIQYGNITCNANCRVCDDGECDSCCTNYYSVGNSCIQCADINCLSCTSSQCYTCASGYAHLVTDSNRCSLCSASTQVNCQSINSCSATSSCASCYLYSLNEVNQCIRCSLTYGNCDKCNNTHCLSCLGSYVLNETANCNTQNIIDKQCGPCLIPYCSYCSTTSTCSNCFYGYYPSNHTCLPCILPCLDCYSQTSCSSCNTTSQLNILISGRCSPCGNINAGCFQCSYSFGFRCNVCLDGYYLQSNSCYRCPSPCLNCSSPTQCLSCINSTYIYVSANLSCFRCQDYYSNCTTCTSSGCVACNIGFIISGSSCILCNTIYPACDTCNDVRCLTCLPGFSTLSNSTCSSDICDSPCSLCGVLRTTCLNCVQTYYLSGTSCLPCVYPCRTCSSSTYCISCFQQMEYSSGVCTPCSLGQQFNPFTLRCEDCPQHCLSCSWWDGCHNCTSPLFALASKQCVDICGDTFATDLQCDAVLGVPNDGCTDSCRVEPNYNCTKVLNTTLINNVSTTVNVSQCSYVGSVSVAIVSAAQSIFANTLKLGFSVRPFLSGMPSNSDPQAYLRSVFVLSPFDALPSYSITVDAHLGVVFFTIDHDADISSVSPTLTINYEHLASVSPMFQYMANLTYSSAPLSQMVAKGRVGEAESEESLQMSRAVYGWSCFLAVGSVLVMGLGVFGKELAGLDQALLCQQLFLQILFSRQRLSFPLLSLSGLKFSTGLHFEGSLIALSNTQSYVLGLDASSFLYHFGANLVFYSIPLVISFFILLYKLRYKHLTAWRDMAQQAYEVIMGETILYLAIFNLSGLIAYAYLFYQPSSENIYYYDSLAISAAVIITIFAIFNFFVKPQIVGIFRSSFKTQTEERNSRNTKIMEKFSACISKKILEKQLNAFYAKITINFYTVYLLYLTLFILLTVFLPFDPLFLVLGLQVLMLVLVTLVRPHFNPFQKLRSLFTWLITVLGTIIVMIKPNSFELILVFLILLTLHWLASVLIIAQSIWSQLKRKCNDRTKVVKNLTKEGLSQNQKTALNQLILRYQNLQTKNQSIDDQVDKINQNFKESISKKGYLKFEDKREGKQIDEQKIQFEEQIIIQEHEHLRYQKGLEFFNKYTDTIDSDLIKEYSNIKGYQQ